MKTKRFLALFMVIVMAVSFAACSKNKSAGKTEVDNIVYYLGDEDTDFDEVFANPSNSVDAKAIYSSIKYTEKMLYGVYAVQNEEKGIKDAQKNMKFEDVEFSNGTFNISVLPIGVSMGKDFICDKLKNYDYEDFRSIEDKEIAVLEFVVTDSKQTGTVPCIYEINGNMIKFTSVEKTSKDGEPLEYAIDGKGVFEYTFSICGPYLTLSNGTESIELIGYSFTDDNQTSYTQLMGYSLPASPLVDNLDYFVTSSGTPINYAVDRLGNYYEKPAVKLSDDGVATIYLKTRDTDETTVKQFAYILNCSGTNFFNSFSIILFDGEKEYYYTDDITSREARQLQTDKKLTDDEIKEIAEKKADLFDDLQKEFKEEGINATINRATGEIALDTTVLFGGDSAVVTDEGKTFLNKFLKAYTNIIYNEKYDGFISKTMIEGHIAPVGNTTYEGGLPLSEERASNVKKYCVSKETGVNTSKLANTLETKGYSQSKPIYDKDGNVDYDASRRVSFRFIVNTEK